MKDESTVQQEVQIQARFFNCHLMRNNSGAFTDNTGRTVRFGLGNVSQKQSDRIKSSDLIGFTEVVITPEMVGKTVAIFTAIECKKEEWNIDKKLDAREVAQNNFLHWITTKGGIAHFCNSVDKLKEIFRQ